MARKAPEISIVMAVYDDYHGVFFSIEALRMYHSEVVERGEIVVVDNHPGSKHGAATKKLLAQIPSGRYIPFTDFVSPMVKGKAVEAAAAPFVLCMDAHVLFVPGALEKLLDFFHTQSNDKDLYQGPLLYTNHRTVHTHFAPQWRGAMFGTWALDPRGKDPAAPPFEIPCQGMGVFALRKAAWPGFNPLHRGFGGEEFYIHEKIRQRGGRCWCLPFLRWEHRFDHPDGVKYPATMEARARNYFLGWLELGLDTEPIIEHFSTKWGSEAKWRQLLAQTMQEMRAARQAVEQPKRMGVVG